jgi:hypothetical protein
LPGAVPRRRPVPDVQRSRARSFVPRSPARPLPGDPVAHPAARPSLLPAPQARPPPGGGRRDGRLCWLWFVRLARRGKDATRFPSLLASFAARAVRSGRLCGQEPSRDALSPLAQQRHGFTVRSIPDGSSLYGNAFNEALADNTRTPPDEQAAFRLDFPAWLLTLTERDRRLVADLMLGDRTLHVADRYRLSPARVSQLRREFREDWRRFHDEPTLAVV